MIANVYNLNEAFYFNPMNLLRITVYLSIYIYRWTFANSWPPFIFQNNESADNELKREKHNINKDRVIIMNRCIWKCCIWNRYRNTTCSIYLHSTRTETNDCIDQLHWSCWDFQNVHESHDSHNIRPNKSAR